MAVDKKLLAELRQKHVGEELYSLAGSSETVIVKGPSEPLWEQMQDKVLDAKATSASKRAAAHNLLIGCLVHPGREQFADLLAKKPGLLQTYTNQISDIAGVDNEAVAEKLDGA